MYSAAEVAAPHSNAARRPTATVWQPPPGPGGPGSPASSPTGLNDPLGGAYTADVREGGLIMATAGSILGNAVLRLEDPTLLTGEGKYVDDLVEPGMLHVAFVRSTIAHGDLVARRCQRGGGDARRGGRLPRRRRRPRSRVVAAVPDDAASR